MTDREKAIQRKKWTGYQRVYQEKLRFRKENMKVKAKRRVVTKSPDLKSKKILLK